MRRLHIDQPVSLSLDEEPRPIACRVVEVEGSTGRLSHGKLPPRAVARLISGWRGYLVFGHLRMPVGLRVAIRARPPHLDVAVIDGIAMPERRRDERVKLVTPARIVTPAGDDPGTSPAWTETIDLSEHGALLRYHEAFEADQPLGVELSFGDDPDPIATQVAIARRSAHAVAVTFESVPAQDATRLHEYLMGLRHQHGRALARR